VLLPAANHQRIGRSLCSANRLHESSAQIDLPAKPHITQEMLNVCGQHNITSDVEVIAIQQVNEAYDRMLRSDVKYRFSIDMAPLKQQGLTKSRT
jgi:hypothetical protein